MSNSGRVRVEIAAGIATLEFHHPKKNSLPGSLLAAMAEQVEKLSAEPEARVIVIRSAGDGPFCAGASFDELVAIDTARRGTEFFMGFARLILAMKGSPKLVIARIQGKAVGGGVGVAAAADYALASETASIKLSELALGIGPFVVGPCVERKLGPGHFAALAIDTGWRDAHWAERHGLYASVHSTIEELDEAVTRLAQRLAASHPAAMTRLKEVFWEGTDHWEQLLAERAAESGTLVLSDFTRRAIAAFQQR